ncbi:MAG: AsmA family protein [Rhodospirillaceae bacterium]
MKPRAGWLVWGLELAGGATAAVIAAALIFLWYANTNDYRKAVMAAVERATGLIVFIDNEVHFAFMPLPTVIATGVRVAHPPWVIGGEMVRAATVEIAFSPLDLLMQRNRIERMVLSGATVDLRRDRHGRVNWWATPATPAPISAEPWQPVDIGRLEIIDSHIEFRDDLYGHIAKIGVVRAVAGLPATGPLAVDGEGDWFGAPFKGTLTGGRFAALVLDEPIWPAALHLESGGAVLDGRGTIDRPMSEQILDVKLSIAGERLSTLSPVTGARLPELGPYRASVRLSGGRSHYRLADLAARLGESDFDGQLTVSLSGARPRLEGHLHSELLDQRDVAVPAAASVALVPVPAAGRVIGAQPFGLESLLALDAQVALKLDRWATWPADLTDFVANLDLDEGRLSVRSLHAQVAGGWIDGRLEVDAGRKAPLIVLSGHGEAMSSEQILPALGMAQSPSGLFTLDLDLSGNGNTPRDLLAGLTGHAALSIGMGTLPVRHFDLIATDLVQAVMPWAKRGDVTDMNCLKARFRIKDGVAVSERLLIDTGKITVTGAGEVNLGTEQLEFLFDPRPKDPSLISLATRMRVSGTLADYRAAPDAMGLAKGVATAGVAFAFIELSPLALFAPFVSPGTRDDNPCQSDTVGRTDPVPSDAFAPLDGMRGFLDGAGRANNRGGLGKAP